MPLLTQTPQDKNLVKLAIIGDGKIGKTHYAAQAAEAGFNLLYLDGDVGLQTLSSMSQEAKARTYYMNLADRVGQGSREPSFSRAIRAFCSQIDFVWNETEHRVANIPDRKNPDVALSWLKPGLLNSDTVLVLDSWTALSESLMLDGAENAGVDMEDSATSDMRGIYGAGTKMANNILQTIRSLPCHVIVICHPDEYTHTIKPANKKIKEIREGDLKVGYSKMIPKSTSRPHGLQMSKYFTDVAWFEMSPVGNERRLNFKVDPNRISGGHFDGSKAADTDYSFAALVKQIGGKVPSANQPMPWLVEHNIQGKADIAPEAKPAPLASTGGTVAKKSPFG